MHSSSGFRFVCSSFALALAIHVGLPGAARSQSLSEAEVSGRVRTVLGEPIRQPTVSVLDEDGNPVRALTGGLDGSFAIRGVGPGLYTVRVEALGFAPRIYTGLRLRPGSGLRLAVELRGAGAPTDTVVAGGVGSTPSAGRWIDGPDLNRLPVETPDLASWAPLSTLVDGSLGMEGLPGQFTRLSVDGLVFRPARPPGLRTLDRGGALLTGRTLSAVAVTPGTPTLELPAGAGGSIASYSIRGAGGRAAADGAVAAGGLRAAATDPDDAPDALSFLGGAVASVVLSPDTSSMVVGVDAWQVERPRAALLPGSGVGEEGIDSPYLARTRGFSGFLRLDRAVSRGGNLWGTARVGYQPGGSDLAGMAWGLEDAGRRIDLLVGAGLLAAVGRRETLEARVGLSRSAWDSPMEAEVDLPFEAGALTAVDLASGARLGPGPLPAGSTSRLDLDVAVTIHADRGDHRLKGGIQAGVGRHEQDWGETAGGWALVGAGSPVGSWNGLVDARGFGDPVSATVPRTTVFIEDAWSVGPGLVIDLGARFDSEWLPLQGEAPSATWTLGSGLPVPNLTEQVSRGSGLLGFRWDGGNGTRVSARASYTSDEVDPLLLGEILASKEFGVFRDADGTYRGWPDVPVPVSSPNLVRPAVAYLPGDAEAPATIRVSGGVGRSAGATTVEVGAVFRRTDGLVRRRDLNRSVAPRGADAAGRYLWGAPLKVGRWVGADPEALGRFDAFGPVWQLDQGGWSEYVGITGRLMGGRAGGLRWSAEYTWSRTEDNLPGLGAMGRVYGVALEAGADDEATVGISDLDRPHRAVATLAVPLPVGEGSALSGVFRYQSGAPFTPGYADGVDANMDGVRGNDPAFVDAAATAAHGGAWSCLDSGDFSTRNGCRTEAVHTLDLRLLIGLPGFGASIFVDALNVLDREMSLIDTALLRAEPGAAITGGGTSTVLPFTPNPGFGEPLRDLSPGRMLRIGLRVGR